MARRSEHAEEADELPAMETVYRVAIPDDKGSAASEREAWQPWVVTEDADGFWLQTPEVFISLGPYPTRADAGSGRLIVESHLHALRVGEVRDEILHFIADCLPVGDEVSNRVIREALAEVRLHPYLRDA